MDAVKMPHRSNTRSGRASRPRTRIASPARTAPPATAPDDRFFRHIVDSMRNGVIAIRRDGSVALMNEEAYRIFSIETNPGDVGRSFRDVLHARPDAIRLLASVFELSHLPNRAELRLKDLDRVIGYTLSQVKDDAGDPIGAIMFFKDLTQVEQMEERSVSAIDWCRSAKWPRASRMNSRTRWLALKSWRGCCAGRCRLQRRAGAARRHPERSQAGERDRRRNAGIRQTVEAAGRADRRRRNAAPGDHPSGIQDRARRGLGAGGRRTRPSGA